MGRWEGGPGELTGLEKCSNEDWKFATLCPNARNRHSHCAGSLLKFRDLTAAIHGWWMTNLSSLGPGSIAIHYNNCSHPTLSLSISTFSTPGSKCDRSHVPYQRGHRYKVGKSCLRPTHYINRSQDATPKSGLLATARPLSLRVPKSSWAISTQLM